jgi:hypothetical protein
MPRSYLALPPDAIDHRPFTLLHRLWTDTSASGLLGHRAGLFVYSAARRSCSITTEVAGARFDRILTIIPSKEPAATFLAEVSKALPDHFAAKLVADAGDHLKNLSRLTCFPVAATRAGRDNVGAEREPTKFAPILELRAALRCGQNGSWRPRCGGEQSERA